MKYFKTFEEFQGMSSTGVDDAGGEVLPKYNPKIQQEVTDFLDNMTPNNKPLVFKWLRMEEPSLNDEEFDDKFEIAKKKLIDFFQENPNISIGGIDIETFTIPGKGGDGVPRLQNIGGSSHANSIRVGEGRHNFDSELEISEEDMLLFRKEEPLIDLIRKGKISLSDKKIEFDKSDKETLDILDIYLEFDQNSLKSDETL
jgi:hypothetical protein